MDNTNKNETPPPKDVKPPKKKRKRMSPKDVANMLGLTAVRGAVSGRIYYE